MLLEEGSYAGDTYNQAGTLAIDQGTQFETETYTQSADAMLYMYADETTPLLVSGDAAVDGGITIDLAAAPLPGVYTYIDAGAHTGEFASVAFENTDPPWWDPYTPQWMPEGGRDYYRGMVGYSFSEAALGLVAAVEDWSLLRWVMSNHLQDVADRQTDLEPGETVVHGQLLASRTERDPATSPAGFDADTKGISFGFDRKVDAETTWGLYAGYTEREIDITNVPPAANDWEQQDTWHIGGYISKRWGNWILSDTLTYRSTDHESYRRQVGDDARGNFDSWSVTNDIRAGYVASEIGEGSDWEVIPEVGVNIGHLNRDGYTESNGFTYGDFDTTVVEGLLGVRMKGRYDSDGGTRFVPQLRLAWVKILSGDDITIDRSWDGDRKWYTEELGDDYFLADLGVTIYNVNNLDISLNYSGRFGDHSSSHGGWLRFEWEF
jgi:outer membrane autotransporter protein